MEPVIIATGVMTILTQFVQKGVEAFAKDAGSAIFEKAKNLFNKIKLKWQKDVSATTIFEGFEKQPDTMKDAVQVLLQKQIENDTEFAKELAEIVQSIKQTGQHIKIVQDIDIAEKKVTMFDIGSVKGRTTIEGEQHVNHAKDEVVAFKATSIGDE